MAIALNRPDLDALRQFCRKAFMHILPNPLRSISLIISGIHFQVYPSAPCPFFCLPAYLSAYKSRKGTQSTICVLRFKRGHHLLYKLIPLSVIMISCGSKLLRKFLPVRIHLFTERIQTAVKIPKLHIDNA